MQRANLLFSEGQYIGPHILDLCFIELLFPRHHGSFGRAVFYDRLQLLEISSCFRRSKNLVPWASAPSRSARTPLRILGKPIGVVLPLLVLNGVCSIPSLASGQLAVTCPIGLVRIFVL
jgi:hypothetical protein